MWLSSTNKSSFSASKERPVLESQPQRFGFCCSCCRCYDGSVVGGGQGYGNGRPGSRKGPGGSRGKGTRGGRGRAKEFSVHACVCSCSCRMLGVKGLLACCWTVRWFHSSMAFAFRLVIVSGYIWACGEDLCLLIVHMFAHEFSMTCVLLLCVFRGGWYGLHALSMLHGAAWVV